MYNTTATTQTYQDVGLRNFMVSVYNNMCMGLLVSGLVGFLMSTNAQLMAAIWTTGFAWVVLLSPLVLAIGVAFVMNYMSVFQARMFFYIFCVAMGASLSQLFMIFKLGSIVQVFVITSAMFATMSVFGYITKKDLTSLGSFLMMGVIGLIVAGVVNIFLQSSALMFALNVIAVLIFTVMTAVETQNLKDTYYTFSGEQREKCGIFGALNLYMCFINIFVNLLQLVGERE